MRRQQDGNSGSRVWLSLLGVSAMALLSGCGWFDSEPVTSQKARPGADRQVPGTAGLPSASAGRQYEQGLSATDETRQPQIGSLVSAKGGQKAQKEAADKKLAEVKARISEERQERYVQERVGRGRGPGGPGGAGEGGRRPGGPGGPQGEGRRRPNDSGGRQ